MLSHRRKSEVPGPVHLITGLVCTIILGMGAEYAIEPLIGPRWSDGLPTPTFTQVEKAAGYLCGKSAADFELTSVGDGPPVSLTELRKQKPVVLVLSSFT